jgi:segregation and condensation protein B
MNTSTLIEALLFSRAEPWTVSELEKALVLPNDTIAEALAELETALTNRGICLVRVENTVSLGTHPDAHAVLEKLYKEELSKGLSKASIETLSIVMYGEQITRGKIDYIRGVNSGFILRSLLVRGLIERMPYPGDRKRFMYQPTIALLATLGVAKREELPDYARIHAELQKAAFGAELAETIDGENKEI